MSIAPPTVLFVLIPSLYVPKTPTLALSGLRVQKQDGQGERAYCGFDYQYGFDANSHRCHLFF